MATIVRSHIRRVRGMRRVRVRKHFRKTLKAVDYQTGKVKSLKADMQRKAMLPGKRVSINRKVYWETRKNRSDLNRKKWV